MKTALSKTRPQGVPLGVVVIVLAVGVMFGGAMMAAFVMPQGAAAPAPSTRAAGVPRTAAEPAPASATVTAFTAPVVSAADGSLVVALPDMPHKGNAVPTVVVRITSSTLLSGRVPKSPQDLDKEGGRAPAAKPDTTKGLPAPPSRTENDLFKDVPMTPSSFRPDDVVRIETADTAGAKEIAATSVTLIYRPETPAEGAAAAPKDGSQPPPSAIKAAPVK